MSGSERSAFPRPVALAVGSAALVAAVFVGVVLVGGSGQDGSGPDGQPTAADEAVEGPFVPRSGSGQRAPDLDLAAFDGEGRVTSDDFDGKPLVLNFWASWCPFCIEEMPAFEQVHQRLGDDVAFLGVDIQDDPGLARRLVEETGVTYELAVDDGALFTALEARAMPTTVLITADGHVADSFGGRAFTAAELEAKILEHLIEPA